MGQMLVLGCGGFLVEDAIFLTEKNKDFLRSRLGFNGDPILNLIPIKTVTSCSTHKIDQQETDG